MRTREWLLAAVVAVAACRAVDSTSSTTRPIVNGEVDPNDPAVVMLAFPGQGAYCSGTVVAPHVILTAAHCLFAPEDSEIWFGPNEDQTTAKISVIHGETHPTYDIGMMTIGAPAPVTPIPMLAVGLDGLLDQPVRIVGYGVTSEDGSDSGTKRQGMTRLHHLENEVMFTGYEGSQTCYGDSGGPNFMTIEGVEHVVGVTSFGTTVCGMPADGAIRTDLPHDWLQAYVDEHEEFEPPTVRITSPGDGASVRAGFTVTAEASDNRQVARVELLIDDAVNDVDEIRPYELNGLPTVPFGGHRVTVRAVDGAGNEASVSIEVTVAPACAGPGECEGDDQCVDGLCLHQLGGGCDMHGECASGVCGVVDGLGICTERCQPDGDSCPSGFQCEPPALAGGSGQCIPGGSTGGCTTTPRPGGAGAPVLLLACALLFTCIHRARSRWR
jgi:hypothetical protein